MKRINLTLELENEQLECDKCSGQIKHRGVAILLVYNEEHSNEVNEILCEACYKRFGEANELS